MCQILAPGQFQLHLASLEMHRLDTKQVKYGHAFQEPAYSCVIAIRPFMRLNNQFRPLAPVHYWTKLYFLVL